MKPIEGFQKVRIASRYNQRIIMVNPGNDDRGFVVCNSCGAAMPIIGISEEPLKNVDRPYLWKFGGRPCRHEVTETVSLGYDFITDMMVLEFQLDEEIIDTNRNNPWIDRAATSLAEALRLSASRLLDIEFTELNSGYRVRNNKNGIT